MPAGPGRGRPRPRGREPLIEDVDRTLAGTLLAAGPHLAPLLGGPGLAPLAAVAARVPDHLSRWAGLEVPLADPGAGADLAAFLPRPALLDGWPVPAGLGDPAPFRALGGLAARPPAPMRGPVLNAWLEWDVASRGSDRASVFVSPGDADRRDPASLAALAGALTGADHRPALARLMAALPPGWEVGQVGAMVGRGGGLRVCLMGADVARGVRGLPAAGWPGDAAGLQDLVAAYAPVAGNAVVALDLTPDGVGPRAGVELLTWQPRGPGALLRLLVADGLCHPARAAAVAAFPGREAEPGPAGWPRTLRASRAFLGPGVPVALVREVNHVKVALDPGGRRTAKAYAGVLCVVGPVPDG